ncbi:MAG: transcriptional repressor [Limnochordaceae bacterium]|nr:transcriptional repressor [Limnochordaceae bacterium]
MQAARRRLEASGVRVTPQRLAVVEVLAAHPDRHFSALELYENARRAHPDLGLATVYRTLPLLEQAGVANRLNVGEEEDRFEFGLEKGHYHHHLICLGCGRIFEFKEDLLEPLERRIEAETGFRVVDHSLHFTGYCPECRAAGRDR